MNRRASGQSLVEYALIVALVGIVATIFLAILGGSVQGGIGIIVAAIGGQKDGARGSERINILTAQCFVVEDQHVTGLWITGLTTLATAELTAGTNIGMGTGIDGAPSPVTSGNAPGTFRYNPLVSGMQADAALCPKGAVVQGPDGLIAVAPVTVEVIP